jgi:outer membrane receptor protein involved in Fe transport
MRGPSPAEGKLALLILAGALAGPADALAESQPAPAAARSAAPQNGVVRYDPQFFTEMRPNTAFDMIQRLPGFAFDPGPQVRGFAGAAGNVLIDGDRPTSKEDDLQSILKRIPASQVDHIDVIRGGAPGIDMHGQTVLANVVRRSGSGVTGVAAVAANIFPDGRFAPGARLEMTRKWDGKTLEFSFLPSLFVDDGAGDGNRVRTDPSGDVLVRSHLDDNAGGLQLNGTTAYETPAWGGKFRVNLLGYYQRYFENTDDHLITPLGTELLRYKQHRAKGELGLHFEKALTPKLSLEALAIQKVQHQNFPSHFIAAGDDELFNETDTSGETIARGVARYRASDTLSAEASLEGAYNIQSSHSTFALNGADVPLPAANVTVSEKRGEAAALTTWRPSKKFTLEAGVRTEISQIDSSGDTVLSKVLVFPKPRVVLTWSPDEADQIRLRAEREVGQLNFADFAASSALGTNGAVHAGNPDLEPARAWVFEAAYEKHILGAVFVLTYRRQEISDVVDRIPITSDTGDVFDAPGNIGSAHEDDILANVTLPLERLGIKRGQLKAQGTLRHSRVKDPTTGQERTISGQHRFDYEAHFTQDLPRWNSSWGIDVFNRWTETYFRFSEIDTYKLKTFVILFLEYKPKPDFSLRMEVDNIGGRGFQRILNVYSGPRNTSGLSYVDDRKQDFKPYLYVRVRKTFG